MLRIEIADGSLRIGSTPNELRGTRIVADAITRMDDLSIHGA